jgi:transposase
LNSWRQFRNRREVGALAGLTPTPYQSGDDSREQGNCKAGNRWIGSIAIEIAWHLTSDQCQTRKENIGGCDEEASKALLRLCVRQLGERRRDLAVNALCAGASAPLSGCTRAASVPLTMRGLAIRNCM